MKRHLTKRELIEYQFNLASDTRLKEIVGHLEGCARCREHLEQLKRKFAALDLLRPDAKISEDLISQVIQQAKQPVRTRTILLRKPTWIGAAAAVLLVGLLLVAHLNKQAVPHREMAKESEPAAEKLKFDAKGERELSDRFDKDVAVEKMVAVAPGESEAEEMDDRRRTTDEPPLVSRASSLLSTTEKPPFAPASAIELVVLPRREKVQLTIYNSADLTLVRERRNLTLKQGWNWLQFMWANTLIDPTSLSLEPLAQADKIYIQQLVFPARLRELGRWLIHSEVSGQVPFEITYFTSGLSWRAFYMGTLSQDETMMQLAGYVRVGNNSGEDYENAQTRLIVGKVHLLDQIAELAKRQYPYDRPVVIEEDKKDHLKQMITREKVFGLRGYGGYAGIAFDELRPKEITKEGLSEYFLYTIEGTETVPDKWGKRLLSFQAEDIKVNSLYKYDQERWGEQTIRFVSFANDEEHNLGDTPIPNGEVKIYSQVDEQGYLSYIGGTDIKYIPVDEEVELNLGPARLVSVKQVLMDFKTDNFTFDRKGNIAGWDEVRTWKIEITNARTLPIEIEITRGFDTAYWTLQFDDQEVSYEKHDATHARFNVNLGPLSKRTFGYTLTTYHGVREESLAQKKN